MHLRHSEAAPGASWHGVNPCGFEVSWDAQQQVDSYIINLQDKNYEFQLLKLLTSTTQSADVFQDNLFKNNFGFLLNQPVAPSDSKSRSANSVSGLRSQKTLSYIHISISLTSIEIFLDSMKTNFKFISRGYQCSQFDTQTCKPETRADHKQTMAEDSWKLQKLKVTKRHIILTCFWCKPSPETWNTCSKQLVCTEPCLQRMFVVLVCFGGDARAKTVLSEAAKGHEKKTLTVCVTFAFHTKDFPANATECILFWNNGST